MEIKKYGNKNPDGSLKTLKFIYDLGIVPK